ncbi:PolyA RNA polymerase gld-2-like protein [Sarcoptes scabiei]|nr:PolyA RNA polymerase gld-2-like protein [Sarcoptes scabiei]
MEKAIRIKFQGGREATGILKGYDTLLNIVLDDTTEYLRDPDDPFKITDFSRQLGLVVCRSSTIVSICPVDGMESIANPFIQHE